MFCIKHWPQTICLFDCILAYAHYRGFRIKKSLWAKGLLCLGLALSLAACASTPAKAPVGVSDTAAELSGDISQFDGVWRYSIFDMKGTVILNKPSIRLEIANRKLQSFDTQGNLVGSGSGTLKGSMIEGTVTAARSAIRRMVLSCTMPRRI